MNAITPPTPLEIAVERASAALKAHQNADGHFVFELEADATIPAEFVLLQHFLDRRDAELERKIGNYLREIACPTGGWPLFHGGKFEISCSVKAYFALKIIGDSPDAPHMKAAREKILSVGGAERTNVFTRIQLALYGEIPWRGVPVMPVEIMLLPRWFPFHLDKVSYWSRTVTTPLLVLMAKKPRARNPLDIHVQELFCTPPEQIKDWIKGPFRSIWGHMFATIDRFLFHLEQHLPKRLRELSIQKAVAFITERLNGEDGLGAIYPAMANTVMMFDILGYDPAHPDAAIAWKALHKLLVIEDDRAYCQPCLSPVWDTGLAGHAIAESDGSGVPDVRTANDWLRSKQILDVVGDWAAQRPGLSPGGWAFQYENPHYPDVDDTAVVAMLLHREDKLRHADSIARAATWVIGMQSKDGGWGAFDAENNKYYLNHIPFADHGALLDPSTADVTARCVSFLAQIGHRADEPCMARAIAWLRSEQLTDGSWFGRWGTNYIYGTWSVLCALNAAGLSHEDPAIKRGAGFLLETQREDGGWGEDNESYADAPRGVYFRSNPSQTAWALMGLMAAGLGNHPAVARGVAYLQTTQKPDGTWEEEPYTAVGFPRVFYLRYHGYKLFFPLMAMARYRNLRSSNDMRVGYGF